MIGGTIRFNQSAMRELLQGEEGGVAKDLIRKAQKVEGGAKRKAPVNTGRLRSSITWELRKDGRGLFVVIGSDVEYAAHQEFGTLYMDAHPYLRPALEEALR